MLDTIGELMDVWRQLVRCRRFGLHGVEVNTTNDGSRLDNRSRRAGQVICCAGGGLARVIFVRHSALRPLDP